MAGDQVEDPYSFYARARASEPVFFSPRFQMWFVTRYDDVRAALSDPGTFSSRGAIPDYSELGPEVQAALEGYRQPRSMINMDPPDHTRLRRLARQAFTPRTVATMREAVQDVATGIVEGFSRRGHADLIPQFAYPLPLAVIFRLLGVPGEDIPACQRWTAQLKELNFGRSKLPVARLVECARGVLAYQRYVERLVAGWAPHERESLISSMVLARDEEGGPSLTVQETADQVQAFIIGGHETLASALGNTLYLLLAEPERWQRVCREPASREAAIEEALRIDTAVTGMIRVTTRAVRLGGVALPAQARLFLLFGSANWDEARFPDPAEYRLERTGQPLHVAFGHGIHYCVGAPLARLELSVAIDVLTAGLPGLRLSAGEQVKHVPDLLFRSLAQLPVVWDNDPHHGKGHL